ncbi:DUF6167 family protein [Streptomyces chattanoogensis]|uniref:Secreted protein n=1 Tax=Streptomyces chattanoogensis TaxID=66876 RepID=A0A0N0XZS7_9ACTN|nr:DUF6167 family protein [Streptomyces chattanoogensis]KPC65148.1 hypothetical protein ADL29_08920 [Streptomyces chattanoogensis]
MFRRAFWFTTGAAAGVWATNKVHRKLRRLQPDSLAAQAADKAVETGHRLRQFALDVRAGMADREEQLNDALGLRGTSEAVELPAPRSHAAHESHHRITRTPGRPGLTGPTGNEDH